MSWNLKSQQSLKSSETLLNHDLYSNSIHCSYYCIVQLLYQIISEELGMSQEEIERSITYDKATTHKWVINKTIFLMRRLPLNKILVKNLNSDINILKENRVRADYSEILADEDLAKKSLENTKKIKKILKDTFKL